MTRPPPDIAAELREIARAVYRETGSVKKAAGAIHAQPNTVKQWKRRYHWRQLVPLNLGISLVKQAEIVPPEPPKGQWMQSLHHESAHFLVEGVPACKGVTGAKVDAGMRWFSHDGCLRKCTRCMAHAEKVI